MDKGMPPQLSLSVQEIIALMDAAKDRGIGSFKGAGIEFVTTQVVRAQSKQRKIVPAAGPPKNAVDLALSLNSVSQEEDEPNE